MATAVQFRRGTTTQNNAFTGALGEVSVDTTLDTIRVHDGSTAGGFEITSNAATQTLTNKSLTAPTLTGTAVMADLDISGDVDVDGTLETDALTIGGVTLAETISDTVGAMVGSNTETGITVSYEDGDNTLDFALGAAQTTITSILATDLKIGEDDQTKIDFETADTINFYAGNEKQLILTDGALTPGADNILDLGSSSIEFKDGYFDGTVTADAFAGPLTGNVTGNASGTALTVTQAAQSAITSLGTLTTLTVDNVIINGTTIGHTSDTDLMTLTSGVLTVAGEVVGTGFTGTLDGILGSGTAAAATVTTLDTSGAVNLNLVTDSTSSTSGALIVDGGVGIAKKLFVGTDLDVDGTANLDVVDIDGAVNMATTALVTGVLTTTATQVANGGITSGSNIVSDTDSTDDLGTTSVRWANLYVDAITATDQITATGFTGTLDGILGSGTAAAATTTTLAATTGTFSGILKTDDATDATSTTDGSLQTDGGLSVAKDVIAGNDVKLLSDGAIITMGANSEINLTHVHDTGITTNGELTSTVIRARKPIKTEFNASGAVTASLTAAESGATVLIHGTENNIINLPAAATTNPGLYYDFIVLTAVGGGTSTIVNIAGSGGQFVGSLSLAGGTAANAVFDNAGDAFTFIASTVVGSRARITCLTDDGTDGVWQVESVASPIATID